MCGCIVSVGVSCFKFILCKIWVVILTLIIGIPDMGLIDFYIIFMSDVDMVDLVDLPAVYALFGDDPRFKIRGFFKSHVLIFW